MPIRPGVIIQGIAIRQADPPQSVNEAFKEVTAAQQDAQSYINRANAYATQLTQKAQGEAAAFDKVYEQYRLAPEVTRRRMYYETMEQILQKVPKTIIEAPGVTPYLPLPEVQRQTQQQHQQSSSASSRGEAANDRLHPQPPAVQRHRRAPLAVHPVQRLPDRSGNQAGGRRPVRQAGAHPRHDQGRASTTGSRSSRTSSGSTSACSRSTWTASRSFRPTSAGSRSTHLRGTGSSIRC